MICYQDRTFCEAQECRHFRECPAAFTDQVKAAAEKIGLPVSRHVNPKVLYCYKPHESTTNSDNQARN